ncbi:MAG: hypothetical protein ACT4P9_06085 [Betaproteobacteria bacterium]
MAPAELRTSGPLQAAVVALALGFLLRDTPEAEPARTWPWVAAGYGVLAAVLPWLAGGYGPGEFSLRNWIVLGVMFAAPVAVGAWLLAGTPYAHISVAFAGLAVLWVVHGTIALALRFRSP